MKTLRAQIVPALLALMFHLLWASSVHAAQPAITYNTPQGLLDRVGHPMSATVTITPSFNGLVIRVTNNTEHMISFEQCISSVSFTLKNGEGAHLGLTQGFARIVYPEGIYTADKPEDTHWKLERAGARINICSPGRTYNIISEAPGKKYEDAEDSLIHSPGRNPFLGGTPSFEVVIPQDGDVQVVDIAVGWGSLSACCGGDTDMTITPDTAVINDVGFLFGDAVSSNGDIFDTGGIAPGGGVSGPPGSSGGGGGGGTGTITGGTPGGSTNPPGGSTTPPGGSTTPPGGSTNPPSNPDNPDNPPNTPDNPPITPDNPPIQPDNPPDTGSPTPEPSTLAMLAFAGFGVLARKRRSSG